MGESLVSSRQEIGQTSGLTRGEVDRDEEVLKGRGGGGR